MYVNGKLYLNVDVMYLNGKVWYMKVVDCYWQIKNNFSDGFKLEPLITYHNIFSTIQCQ